MAKVICIIGIQASGKSTLAKKFLKANPTAVWVNKDNIRMFHNRAYSSINEIFVRKMYESALETALNMGLDVVCDDAGLLERHHMEVVERISAQYKAEIFIDRSCLETPLAECIKRDNMRMNGVGESVIRTWFDRHIGYPQIEFAPSKQDAIILDIDGCAAKWQPNHGVDDTSFGDVNHCVWLMVNNMPSTVQVIVITGREENPGVRDELVHWLKDNNWRVPELIYMRPVGCRDRAGDFKRQILEENVLPSYNILWAIDDDETVIQAYRQLGIDTIQPNLR